MPLHGEDGKDQGGGGGGAGGEQHHDDGPNQGVQAQAQPEERQAAQTEARPPAAQVQRTVTRHRPRHKKAASSTSTHVSHSQSSQGVQATHQNQPAAQAKPSTSQEKPQGNLARSKSSQKSAAHPVSKQLQSLGVSRQPHRFSSSSQILRTERGRSSITLPSQGMNGQAIRGQAVSAKNFNNSMVRNQMGFINSGGNGFSNAQISVQMRSEGDRNHYYWHHSGGFDYAHYNDAWGYSWYGWYVGDSYFWTRYYSDRWWFYDDSADRWCYWSYGNWWWQDPDNMGSFYLYQDDNYVAADFGSTN